GLAARIRASGALVSEVPPGTPPGRRNFPRRNRLISGLAQGTGGLEAARYSGSLITAPRAGERGPPLFAIPGSVNNPLSAGCHKLIRDGAALVEEASQVLQWLKIPLPNEGLGYRSRQPPPREVMDKGYEMLLDAVGFEPATVDAL